MRSSSFLKGDTVVHGLFWLLLFCIPLGTRHLLGSAIWGFHEYESFFLYATDILVVGLLIALAWRARAQKYLVRISREWPLIVLGLFLLSAIVSVGYAVLPSLAWYAVARLCVLVLIAVLAGRVVKESAWSLGLTALVASSVVQAGIVTAQFFKQASLGLSLLGEPVLVVGTPSASTIVFEGARVLRAYGTFPHPNVAGLFLVFGLLISLYWYLRQSAASDLLFRGMGRREFLLRSKEERMILFRKFFFSRTFACKIGSVSLFFAHACALVFTFSRSAWVAATVGTLTLLLFYLRLSPRVVLRALLVVMATVSVLLFAFAPYIVPRAQVQRSEPAVTERLRFYEVAQRSLSLYPEGVGIGNQIASSVSEGFYRQEGMRRVWQWEPIHNLFVLVATEVGLVGGALFLVFFTLLFVATSRSSSPLRGIACALLGAVLVAGLFDHYLWTLQPGRLMLWIVVGMALSQIASNTSKRVASRK